jgi:hypothetical protein
VHKGQLLTQKYEPSVFSDLLSDGRINREVLGWLKNWGKVSKAGMTNMFFKKPAAPGE